MPQTALAKAAMKRGFMQLYREKEYERITVKELCARAPVARTTFYAYYQNTDELKCEIEDDLIRGITRIGEETFRGGQTEMDFSAFLSQTLAYIGEHREEIQAFLVLQPNARFILKWKEAIKRHLALKFPGSVGAVNYGLAVEAASSAVIGAYSYWMRHPEEVDVERLNQMMASALQAAEAVV